jgi:hypothetical protein
MVITLAIAVIRWLTAAHVFSGRWAATVPQTTAAYVLTFLPVVLFILPEVGSITFGGLKIEMRRTQAEVSKLGDQIHLLQIQQAAAAANASSGHQVIFGDKAAVAATLANIGVTASEKLADTLGDEPSSAVDAFLNPENTGMDESAGQG